MNLRQDFPQLKVKVNGHDLIYFDSAATTLKPQVVIDRVSQHYSFEVANIHRGAHTLSQRGTSQYESTREKTANFLNALPEEIIFNSGTTEGINFVAATAGSRQVGPGDEILITELEHHANIVPWQVLAEQKQATVRVVKVLDSGDIDLEDFKRKLNPKTKIFSVTACSNTLGTITPVKTLIAAAKAAGALCVIDAAQWVSREKIDVQDLGCDFLVFSAHKLFGPSGVGVLYGRKSLLETLPPYRTGGSMISEVTFEKSSYNQIPFKFEAGTPNICGVIGFGAALDFFMSLSLSELQRHEDDFSKELRNCLSQFPDLKILGHPQKSGPICSFGVEGIHHSDLAQLLDEQGIAVRAGHLCTQPLLRRFGLTGTTRVSWSVYNSVNEIEPFEIALKKAIRLLK